MRKNGCERIFKKSLNPPNESFFKIEGSLSHWIGMWATSPEWPNVWKNILNLINFLFFKARKTEEK